MLELLTLLPIAGRSVGSFLASKLLKQVGKRAFRTEWRKIIKEMDKLSDSHEDRGNLKKLLDKSIFEELYSTTGDSLKEILERTEISDETSEIIISKIQYFLLELAKNNPNFFYEYMVEAEKSQLEGIQEIKNALGLADSNLGELAWRSV